MITVVKPDFDPYPEDAPTCAYCDSKIGEGESISVVSKADYTCVIVLHRNCVVAFAARILNEFDKL